MFDWSRIYNVTTSKGKKNMKLFQEINNFERSAFERSEVNLIGYIKKI